MPPDYKLVELPTFGGTFATVNALNENGVMVGGAQIPGGKFRAFVASTSGNSITDLGTPEGHGSVANAINDLGQVVGYDYVSEGDPHAFLCSGDCSDFVELNGVTTGLPKGVGLRDAYGITNTGKIIAQGTNARLYLLTPQ
jgi:probable HAF family extracellular repeat protein